MYHETVTLRIKISLALFFHFSFNISENYISFAENTRLIVLMRHYIYLSLTLIVLLSSARPSFAASSKLEFWLDKLDVSLAQKDKYESAHKQQINSLRNLLNKDESLDTHFQICQRIFQAYQYYKADSAAFYAHQCLIIAEKLKRSDYIVTSRCYMAFVAISTGDFTWARQMLSAINPSTLPNGLKLKYYDVLAKFYIEQYHFISNEPAHSWYSRLFLQANDSCIALTKPNSAQWLAYQATKADHLQHTKEALNYQERYLALSNLSKHERAMQLASSAWSKLILGQKEEGIIAFIQSAIYDNESSTREITALYEVGRLIQQSDPDRASRYVNQALTWLEFYNARLRLIEVGEIIPAIELERVNALQKQKFLLIVIILIVALFTTYFVFSLSYLHRKNIKLKEEQGQVQDHAEELKKINDQLAESDKIKTEYIGQTFYLTSKHLQNLGHLFNSINKEMVKKNYNAISSITSQTTIDHERKTMFADFDKTFLSLFPDFVEKYNDLFDEADRKLPADNESLTSEMRIFALIKLGIKDSEHIAKFLGYSVHTVNTYKTRVKNRSKVNNDDFEAQIMAICVNTTKKSFLPNSSDYQRIKKI